MISAKTIAASKNEFGDRITTMVVTFPRIILAELNTHRMLSKNSASSRAIPFKKIIKAVKENPFIPIAWQKDHKGMQGTEYFDETCSLILRNKWLRARDRAIESALDLASGIFTPETEFEWNEEGELITLQDNVGVTKQICNRLLEPFMWHTVILTATAWENFFALRCPQYTDRTGKYYRSWKDLVKNSEDVMTAIGVNKMTTLERLQNNKGQAEIHMMALAEAMWDAYNESTPKLLKAGEWHIPFGDNMEHLTSLATVEDINDGTFERIKIKVATARCARVSYTVVGEEGKPDNYENDIKLHDRLLSSGHMSPFEHCARAMNEDITSGNFTGGWLQYRKTIKGENIK